MKPKKREHDEQVTERPSEGGSIIPNPLRTVISSDPSTKVTRYHHGTEASNPVVTEPSGKEYTIHYTSKYGKRKWKKSLLSNVKTSNIEITSHVCYKIKNTNKKRLHRLLDDKNKGE